jgi:hypothetical protein
MLEPLWNVPKLGHVSASLSIAYWPEVSAKSVIFIFFLGVPWLASDEANRNMNVLEFFSIVRMWIVWTTHFHELTKSQKYHSFGCLCVMPQFMEPTKISSDISRIFLVPELASVSCVDPIADSFK